MAHAPMMVSEDRATAYQEVATQLAAVLDGEPNQVARMASAVSLLVSAFRPRFFWTGFYVVDPLVPEMLVVGPYQGTLGCLRIAFGRGVCGTAAQQQRAQLVPDVEAFPGHIACDARSRSEVVVPAFDAKGRLCAVLDVDSEEPDAFDDVDVAGLARVCALVFGEAEAAQGAAQ